MLLFTRFPKESPQSSDLILGDNDEVFHSIKSLLSGSLPSPSVYVWSEPSGGKSMLLYAAHITARQNNIASYWLDAAAAPVENHIPLAAGLFIIDNIDRATPEGAQAIIQWLNRCYNQMDETAAAKNNNNKTAAGYFFLASGSHPPAALAEHVGINKEMTTRLAKGLVFHLRPLNDDEKKAALLKHARTRGFTLSEAVVDLLLCYLPRNMGSLISVLDELDNFFLKQKKDITPARVRAWLEAHKNPELNL